jgi:hypothetical protein
MRAAMAQRHRDLAPAAPAPHDRDALGDARRRNSS